MSVKLIASVSLDDLVDSLDTTQLVTNELGKKDQSKSKLIFYDNGGQNVFQTPNALFLTDGCLIILVFNMQEVWAINSLPLLHSLYLFSAFHQCLIAVEFLFMMLPPRSQVMQVSSVDALVSWFEMVETFAPSSIVIIVGTRAGMDKNTSTLAF